MEVVYAQRSEPWTNQSFDIVDQGDHASWPRATHHLTACAWVVIGLQEGREKCYPHQARKAYKGTAMRDR